jgi:protocatechuate 3,4-dioxygenase beta subunit
VTWTIHGQWTTEWWTDAWLVSSINLAPTQNSIENNFGLVTITSSIQGIIYHDRWYTQSWSTWDSPLSWVSVQLISSTWAIVATTVTNTYGVYYFDHLFTGSYTVSYAVPTWYTADSRQIGMVNGVTTWTLWTLTVLNDIFVGNNQQGTMYNFGLVQVSHIAWFVYEDFVYDKVLWSWDISLSWITVYLASSTWVILSTMQTDAAWRYDFTWLVVGTYFVSIDAITGMTNHVANTWTYGAVIDTTHLGPIDLPQASASVWNNFWAVYRARLEWVVYKDIAADGTKSAVDAWIAWQTVTLKTSTWWVIATSTTSSTGWYSFDNLMPDTYTVSYANSTNFLPYNIHTWSVGWTTSWFQSMTVVINPSDNAVNYDFGLIEPASVQWVTYYDNTNNDIYNSGDPLLSWMTVTLQWTTVRGEIVTLTTTTDNIWSYLFDKLTPGTYKVHYSNTNPNYFHDSAQVWINNSVLGTVASYQQIDGIWISVWDHAINYNFGLIDIAFGSRLWGIVYTDLDMSSRQTSGDSIYPWATVILQGTPTTWASFVRTTTTDSQGQYLFTNLPQGTYTVTLSGASIDNRYQAYASNAWTVSGNTTWQGTTEW